MSKSIVFYFHVHQPWRVKPYSVFDISADHQYFTSKEGDTNNRAILEKVANKSYRPMNQLLEKLLAEHPGFKFSLSITGTLLEQLEAWAPDVVESFKRLIATGRVEVVSETYNHSLAFFYSQSEFERQVNQHTKKIKQLFNYTPTAFRNTELSYNNELAKWADEAGYTTILAEGWDPILEWRSPNHVYRPVETTNIRLMLKNYRLSDDIAFRFSNRGWSEFPLTAEKFDSWANDATYEADVLNLFMDYETFGEHHWEDSGIFHFFESFIGQWQKNKGNGFATVTEAALMYEVKDEISMPHTVTWADSERDLTAWLGNAMQQEAMKYLYDMEDSILHSGDQHLIDDWRKLQTSDHVYYMCTKWFSDGDVHAYFSPYNSPYDAFLYYINAIRDIRWRAMNDQQIGGIHG